MPGEFLSALLVLHLYTSSSYAIEYTDVEAMGFTECPARSTCDENTTKFKNDTSAICRCDSACQSYFDCCIDIYQRPLSIRSATHAICLPSGLSGYYVIGGCPSAYKGPMRSRCENDDYQDPLLSAPVTDTSRRNRPRTFLNRYCAECNGASDTSLTTWIINVTFINPDLQHNELEAMTYREDLKAWGMEHNGVFHKSTFRFLKPHSVSNLRSCYPNLISTCPPNYRRRSIMMDCASYTLAVSSSKNFYRNPHCALCNGGTLDKMRCLTLDKISHKKKFSFALTVDVNRGKGEIVGELSRCPSNQIYDPFFEKCRRVVRSLPFSE